MTDVRTIRTHFSLRELTRFTSAALAWAVFATAIAGLVLGGASAGIRPFNKIVELRGQPRSEGRTPVTQELRSGQERTGLQNGGDMG